MVLAIIWFVLAALMGIGATFGLLKTLNENAGQAEPAYVVGLYFFPALFLFLGLQRCVKVNKKDDTDASS